MSTRSISSLRGTLSALPLSWREHGAIASAIAPLMIIFVMVAAPRPALAQPADTLYAPQRTSLPLADADLPPVLRLAALGPREPAAALADMPAALPLPTMTRNDKPGRQLADATRGLPRRMCAAPELQANLRALRGKAPPAPALMREPIIGTASTYNPLADPLAGDKETASGEIYDAEAWTAAIQADLRGRFGGVRYGCNYREAYALLESAGKRVIVKINDVGRLRPGRVIDITDRAMRYFDPTLERGLVPDMRVTPLENNEWTPGPVDEGGIRAAAIAPPERPLRAQFAARLN
ncbi:MAG TPA: septal ring lytic transglycosylase RlpA family protein [Pseudolabrys sp.]|jgi:rare lipoprotein A